MRTLGFLFSVLAYFAFFIVFVYFIAFVEGLVPWKSVDYGAMNAPLLGAAIVDNVVVILLFGLQHSIMARRPFKAAIMRVVPETMERSIYVLASTVVLAVIVVFWQPMPGVFWHVGNETARIVLYVVSLGGWALLLLSSFLINHFDLFGLRQGWFHLQGSSYEQVPFQQPWLYRKVRHPLYLGLLIGLWVAPTMTWGHLVLAVGMTVYILIGVTYEEKDLIANFGETYRQYRSHVPMLFPRLWR